MRILFITEHFAPEPNCITSGLSEELVRAGHSVRVITAHPNYPIGRFYAGVTTPWLPKRSTENGVHIWRLPIIPYHGKSKIKRAISYLSFLIFALLWIIFTQLIWFPRRVIVYQTPFTMGLAALPFKVIRSKIVFLCVDLWPESFVASGVAPNGGLLKALFLYSRFINRIAQILITSTQSMRLRYIRDGIDPVRVHFVPVWVDGIPQQLGPVVPQTGFPRKVVYAGNIGPAQSLGVLVQALAQVIDLSDKLSVEIIGYGTEEEMLKNMVRDLGLTNIIFRGLVSPQEAFASTSAATASLVHLASSPMFRMTLPSKIASCLASGTVLLCGVDGEASELFSDHPGILRFASGSVSELAAHLRSLATMGESEILLRARASRAIYENTFHRDLLTAKYCELCTS
jgi:colanic acid biosynthesis glycosyl transferase WcaI